MGRTSDAKERLMAAIIDLVSEGSYGSLRIDDICKRADVKKGSFYYFFPSKEDLIIDALEHMWTKDWKPFLDASFSPSLPPLERLRNYLKNGVAKQEELAEKSGKVQGCSILSLASEVSSQDERVAEKARDVFSRKRRYLESCIRDAIAEGEIPECDAAKRAACLWSYLEGALVQARILNSLEPIRQMPHMAIALIKASNKAEIAR